MQDKLDKLKKEYFLTNFPGKKSIASLGIVGMTIITEGLATPLSAVDQDAWNNFEGYFTSALNEATNINQITKNTAESLCESITAYLSTAGFNPGIIGRIRRLLNDWASAP
jgi:hypothetical protein